MLVLNGWIGLISASNYFLVLFNQELFELKLKQEEESKQKQKDEFGNFHIDYDFSELDQERALAKLRHASTKYDRNLPGCKSLDCFEVHHLGPGKFREALTRTFNLHFTDKEMGMLSLSFPLCVQK